MCLQLINHNQDLKKLRDEGFEIEILGGHLVVHQVPYVKSSREIAFGKLITTLNRNGDKVLRPETHIIHFMGEYPCDKNGAPISQLKYKSQNSILSNEIILNHSFSNRPQNGYIDYYDKISNYVRLISHEAVAINSEVTPKTFKTIISKEDSVFNYFDTNSSRANIIELNKKFENLKIGIIGLGGTGSYVLDLIAKTPVEEIHLFDGDDFLQHNSFRSPGAPTIETLSKQKKKVEYFAEIYSNMRKGIVAQPNYIEKQNLNQLNGIGFFFICVDNNEAKETILEELLKIKKPFIDVGMGVNLANNDLIGTLRVTLADEFKHEHVEQRIDFSAKANDEYATNIQIADLNALNATLAVIKWKKYIGFYQDLKNEYNSAYIINTGQLINEDQA